MNDIVLKNKTLSHGQVLSLAVPMIISNISTPLLGLVDTAVMGHLDSPQFLGAVALGGLIFSFVYWGFGFLRMGTTGLTAQAFGESDGGEIKIILLRAVLLSQLIAGLILLLNQPLAEFAFWLVDGSAPVEAMATRYFEIRIWSAPATLCMYVLAGWFLGMQNVKAPLLVVLVTNFSNIGLDIALVYYWKMGVAGVALASVIAEYLGLAVALLTLRRRLRPLGGSVRRLADVDKLSAMLAVNGNIFVRTWCLIFAFAFFTAQGARLGETILAANAVLLNFQTFMAYALDGFAHAAEALVGRAVGARNRDLLVASMKIAGIWSFAVAAAFVAVYGLYGQELIDLLTGLQPVRETAYRYLPWLIVMPLVAFGCYLFDGIFIGAMLTRQMRDTMLFSLFACYLPVWYWSREWGNQGLWLAMTAFMLARGLSMGFAFRRAMYRFLKDFPLPA